VEGGKGKSRGKGKGERRGGKRRGWDGIYAPFRKFLDPPLIILSAHIKVLSSVQVYIAAF